MIASGFYDQIKTIEAVQLSPGLRNPLQKFELRSLSPKYDHIMPSQQQNLRREVPDRVSANDGTAPQSTDRRTNSQATQSLDHDSPQVA